MKIKQYSLLLLISAIMLSCSKDDDNNPQPVPPPVATTGMLIINEGNYYSGIDGSLSYFDYATGKMTNNVFASMNGKSLGGTPNDIISCGGQYFIPVTEENLVWILDENMKALTSLQVTKPRRVAAGGNSVFISSYDGHVYAYNLTTKTLTKSEVVGACLEDIVFLRDYVYVCNAYNADYTYNTNVVKLKASNLEKVADITVLCNPTSIETDGNNIYVLSVGNYADVNNTLQCIDASDKVTTMFEATYFALGNGKLYYVASTYDENWQAVTTYNVCDLNTTKTSVFTEGKEVLYPAGIAADATTGNVCIISYLLSEYGYGDYNSPGYVVRYDKDGQCLGQHTVGVCAKTICFIEK